MEEGCWLLIVRHKRIIGAITWDIAPASSDRRLTSSSHDTPSRLPLNFIPSISGLSAREFGFEEYCFLFIVFCIYSSKTWRIYFRHFRHHVRRTLQARERLHSRCRQADPRGRESCKGLKYYTSAGFDRADPSVDRSPGCCWQAYGIGEAGQTSMPPRFPSHYLHIYLTILTRPPISQARLDSSSLSSRLLEMPAIGTSSTTKCSFYPRSMGSSNKLQRRWCKWWWAFWMRHLIWMLSYLSLRHFEQWQTERFEFVHVLLACR